MSLFTGKGDKGTSKLFDTPSGMRISKADVIFEALGSLDELNTFVGWAKVAAKESTIENRLMGDVLHDVQDHIFTLQAEIAGAPKSIPEASVVAIELIINAIESALPPITTFLVPGGTEFSARLDIARAMSRHVERVLVRVRESGERSLGEHSMRYANRLSSLLYALVRFVNHQAEVEETAPAYK
jgi:cob(I)alamin adenosyltransferase